MQPHESSPLSGEAYAEDMLLEDKRWHETPVVPSRRSRRVRLMVMLLVAGTAAVTGAAKMTSGGWTQGDGAGSDRRFSPEASQELDLDCHTAEHGDRCHADVSFAMRNRHLHPEWYIGLNNCSTFTDFQAFMHTQVLNSGERRCPKPCASKPRFAAASGTKCKTAKKERNCHTAVPGDECYAHALFTQKQVIKHPKWYPGLSEDSTLVEVQHYLHSENVCPEPCEVATRQRNASKDLKGCHTALPGETCFSDILLAKHKFIVKHPEWYKGLSSASSNDEFQAFLHYQHHSDTADAKSKACPIPCNASIVNETRLELTCKTAEQGDGCFESVLWGATKGIVDHPKWYAGLTRNSTFEEFQLHLHKDNHTKCHHLPCPCQEVVKGDKCYWSVQWAMTKGIKEYPEAFKGLDSTSAFKEFQAHLHEQRSSVCGKPCKTFTDPRSPWKEVVFA